MGEPGALYPPAGAYGAAAERPHPRTAWLAWSELGSPIGPLLVAVTDVGVVRVGFGHENRDSLLGELMHRLSPRQVGPPRRTDEALRQLEEYFEGRRERFDAAVDWRLSQGHRRRVLEILPAVAPFGQVAYYRDLAVATGRPGASRAVGTAMATNPAPVVVPCHRVVRSDGRIGAYRGGIDAKRWLLRHEGSLTA